MAIGYALLVGAMFGLALYLLMREDVMEQVFGLVALNHAANLLVFGAGRLRRGEPPILGDEPAITDPLPQALVLTAIVIGFGTVAFATVLAGRLRESRETADLPPEEG